MSLDTNDGLDSLGCDDVVGFDAMSLLSGAGGMLSGMFGGGGGDAKGGKPDAATQILQMQEKQAEASAANMKMILIGVAAIAGAGLIVVLSRK